MTLPGTVADARWSLAVRWFLDSDEHPEIMHPWKSQVHLGDLEERVGLPRSHHQSIDFAIYQILTDEERVALTLLGVKWEPYDPDDHEPEYLEALLKIPGWGLDELQQPVYTGRERVSVSDL